MTAYSSPARRHLRRALLGATSLGLLLPPAAARAAETGAAVQEVIVTATRREEAIQNVPLSVTALTAKEVAADRVQTFADAFQKVPGTTFLPIKGSSQSTPRIRGQSANNESPALDVPIGMFIDELYYGGPASYSADFFDIEQIAVLKGPQGTTFGRNVVGGAIQVTSQRPVMGSNSGQVGVTVGNYDAFETRGFVNGSLGENLAGRLAFSVKQRDGYDYNATTDTHINDEKVWSVRGSIRAQPREGLDILAIVSHTHQDNYGDAPKFVGPKNLTLLSTQSDDPHTVYLDENGINRRNIWAAVVNVGVDTPLGEVRSITGYHWLKGLWRNDVDTRPQPIFWPADNFNKESSLSQEFRLVSPSGKTLEYVVGVYGAVDHAYKFLDLRANGCDTTLFFNLLNTAGGAPCLRTPSLNQGVHVTSVAPYGEVTWNVNDALALTVGGRYSYIRKKGNTNHFQSSYAYGAGFMARFDKSWTAFTPRAVLEFRPRENSLLFASVSKGFTSGGFSESVISKALAETPLKPEKSTSYEIGSKNQFFDKRLTVNLDAYLARTKDLQTKNFVGSFFIETNAGEVEVKGVEVEVSAQINPDLLVGVNYAYTDAKYKEFRDCTATHTDCTGNPLAYVPKNDVLIYAQYNRELGNGGLIEVRGDIKFADAVNTEQTNTVNLYAEPLTKKDGILNGSITYRPKQGNWDVQVWGKNLLNKDYAVFVSNYFFFAITKAEFAAGFNDVSRTLFGPPRTYGVTLNYRF